jgi:site-specific DNA-cytosine methylase
MLTNATIQETKTELFMKQVRQSKKKPFVLPKELKGKKFRIRKLTPRECFRLMGVDDADIDKIQTTSLSKSSQYKLAGNSIVVDNLYHLFRKMFIEKEPDKSDKPQQLSLF